MGSCCSSLREVATQSKKHRRVEAWRATGVVGLRGEELREFPAVIRDVAPRLTAIDASMNHIRSLPSFLDSCRQLNRLILSRNELVTLPDSLGQLQQLKVLVLDFNKISTFPVSFCSLKSLEKLSMASNCLSEIPEQLGQLTLLKDIDLSENRISQLHCSFEAMKDLERLNLNGNTLQALPVSLRFCLRLRELLCDRNQMAAVPSEILIECQALQTLSLDGNPITRDALEATDGYKEFEKRRREKASKAISSQVMLGDNTLNEAISRQT